MRYRPFVPHGAAISCVSLVLTDQAMRHDERIRLIYGALECGINAFELSGHDPNVAAALGEALSSIDRRLVFVMQRLGWARDRSGHRVRDLSAEGLTGLIERQLAASQLGRLDLAILDVADGEELPAHVFPALYSVVKGQKVKMLGVAGGDGVDRYLDTKEFDVLCTAYNIKSGWRERNRLRRASMADMPIIGCDYQPFAPPAAVEEEASPSRFSLGRLFGGGKPKVKPTDAYAFLERDRVWSAEEICLGYALTEPALTTVQVRCRTIEELQKLAAVAEKELPNGVAAQIEMARFSAGDAVGAA